MRPVHVNAIYAFLLPELKAPSMRPIHVYAFLLPALKAPSMRPNT
jgi:hypothetical protein